MLTDVVRQQCLEIWSAGAAEKTELLKLYVMNRGLKRQPATVKCAWNSTQALDQIHSSGSKSLLTWTFVWRLYLVLPLGADCLGWCRVAHVSWWCFQHHHLYFLLLAQHGHPMDSMDTWKVLWTCGPELVQAKPWGYKSRFSLCSAKKGRDCFNLSAKLSFAGWTLADLAAASQPQGLNAPSQQAPTCPGCPGRQHVEAGEVLTAGQEKPMLVSPWGLLCTEPKFPPWWLGVCVRGAMYLLSTVGVVSSNRDSRSLKNIFHVHITGYNSWRKILNYLQRA